MRHDKGYDLTEKELKTLEKRIYDSYKEAYDGLTDIIKEYFAKFADRDEAEKARLDAGDITEEQYKQWRLAQIGRGKRFEALRDKVAERMTNANAAAVAYVNDATPGIYSLNRNFAAYTIEQVTGDVGFDLWDEQTVKRLIVEQPELMPYYPPKRALKRGIDLAWGKKQITASVTSSILQGKSIKHMADDLQSRIVTMNRDSAIRTARTAVTGAQNAGRMDSYFAAEKMGIKCRKEWMATLDGRTRHSHAMLDGEVVDNDKKFSNGCRFPGDPQGRPEEIYNCRCTLVSVIAGIDTSRGQRRARNPETGRNELIENMNYAEWAGWKRQEEMDVPSEFRKELMSKNITCNPVQKLENPLTIDEIVEKVGGGDMTSGSCASAAFAYAANRNGLDVTDFRGGKSQETFSLNKNIIRISEMSGGTIVKGTDDYKCVSQMLKKIVEGKEYYMATGQHVAIVRKIDGHYEYLELQSAKNNGFHHLTTQILKDRFGCRKSRSVAGLKLEHSNVIIDIDKLDYGGEFSKILGYLNTSTELQRKGSDGHIK